MTNRPADEVNFDGLVGPTHNYAGLSLGNRASTANAGARSSPRRAALQGIAKMRRLHHLGLVQGVLPPPLRPDPEALESLGFSTMAQVSQTAPALVPVLMSASSMWAANAATVSPSADTADGRVHFTPANLVSTTHRAFEPTATGHMLRTIFADRSTFAVHPPLPSTAAFADEGAANHGRITRAHGDPGTQVFVYGRDADEPVVKSRFPRRQTRLAGELIAASHGTRQAIFVRQSSEAIDAGAFHNDVVSVFNQDVVFAHQRAFESPQQTYDTLGVRVVEVPDWRVPLADAISSYLFNSQLVTLPDGSMTLVAPGEVEQIDTTRIYLEEAVADPANPIDAVEIMDLRESMRNGGGPACLRLRVVLTPEERQAVTGRVLVDDALLDELEAWVERHYRDELDGTDLGDDGFIEEIRGSLGELEEMLELPGLYPSID